MICILIASNLLNALLREGYFLSILQLIGYLTPMTATISDAEENGFVFAFSGFKGFITPRIPINRIILMLEEVGGFFFY